MKITGSSRHYKATKGELYPLSLYKGNIWNSRDLGMFLALGQLRQNQDLKFQKQNETMLSLDHSLTPSQLLGPQKGLVGVWGILP